MALMTSALYLYYAVTVWSLLDHMKEGPLKDYVRGPGLHIELLISSVGLAILMVLINQWSESPRLRRRSFGRIILIKSGLYLAGILLLAALTLLALWLFVMTRDDLLALFALMTGRLFISVWGWFILSILAVNFLMEVRRKVGPGNLAALVTGKYHRPKSEDRLFLFLDLKDSTAIAETLGHERYSQLIRECFHDLTEVVVQSGASIYQYAGDEVILTWRTNKERSAEMCVAAFFAFEKKLSDRGDTYRDRYGTRPTFRAGAEAGVVTATEVGDIKRDIAYHGDPLNTAARLLDLCNSVGRRLLISDRIRQMIRESAGFLIDREGEYQLRGKAAAVAVYGVSEASAVT
jgi:adenylate cyclase